MGPTLIRTLCNEARADQRLAPLDEARPRPPRAVRLIVARTGKVLGIEPRHITAPGRGAPKVVRARQIAMYVAYENTAASYPEIAAALNKSCHTTIMNGHRAIGEIIESDPDGDVARCVAEISKIPMPARRSV